VLLPVQGDREEGLGTRRLGLGVRVRVSRGVRCGIPLAR
jgi:hypothetical protein